MAGTRRRARISDTTAATATTIAAPVPAPVPVAVAVPVPAASLASGSGSGSGSAEVDNGSPGPSQSPSLPVSRSTTGVCQRCRGSVGDFYNSWHKITGSYFLPAMLSSYSSRLREHGKQKQATKGTELDGCLIQPLACPNCTDNLGLRVVDAISSKQAFRGRDFFKLSRIELRCNISDDRAVLVDPILDTASVPSLHADRSPSPVPVNRPPADAMEVDSRPPPPPPSGPLHPLHDHHHHHHHHHHQPPPPHHHHHHPHPHHQPQPQPLQQVEPNRQSLPPPLRSPDAPLPHHSLPQKSPSNQLPSPAVKPVHDVQYSAPKDPGPGLANRSRELPPVTIPHSHPQPPAEQQQQQQQQQQHRTNGQYYPRPVQDVQLDAIERLQTQVSQNSGAISAHGRNLDRFGETLQHQEETIRREFQGQLQHQHLELRRVDDAVGRLHSEMLGIRELLEALGREVHASRELREVQVSRGVGTPSVQDSALELMAQQVAVIAQKANEVDTLKITIEIMKNKIQRLEDAPAAAQQPPQNAYASPREPSAQSVQSSHTVASYHNTPVAAHVNTPAHPSTQRPQPYHSHSAPSVPATPELSQRAEPTPSQNGWVSVNANAKRAHPNGVDAHEGAVQPVGSPKRPKLTPLEPRGAYSQQSYEHMDTDDSDGRIQTHSHTLPSQTQSHESIPESILSSQQHSGFVAYSTQEAPLDDSWRPESQRISRGRGRGGGPGSRGGRGRKSLPAQLHTLGTPEWEREDWQGIGDSQTSPDGYYNHVARSGRGIIRRGGGGGGGSTRGRPSSSSGRAVSLGLQGVSAGVALSGDPYAHTKKTRTKPTRNADGILIRKDGRPDMRSQSSAANLRKVHARKEDLPKDERGFTPTNFAQSHVVTETPSPTGYLPPGQDVTASVQKKHSAIMGKMFPGGVDEAQKEHDYSRKVFQEDKDHTAHPRSQNHHHHHHHHHHHQQQQHPVQSPTGIKREQAERRLPDSRSQSSNDGDVDMDRVEDHADDEGQSPGEQSDHSGTASQYHDAQNSEEPQRGVLEPKENGGVEPTPSTAQSSATLDTMSTVRATA